MADTGPLITQAKATSPAATNVVLHVLGANFGASAQDGGTVLVDDTPCTVRSWSHLLVECEAAADAVGSPVHVEVGGQRSAAVVWRHDRARAL